MRFFRRRFGCVALNILLSSSFWGVIGCASPGSPRPPSLNLPEAPTDLTAQRVGDAVQIRFTVPSRTTDGQRIREKSLSGVLCRQVGNGPCKLTDEAETRTPVPGASAGERDPGAVLWTDTLPPELQAGPPRVIGYRVELRNGAGRGAGYSEPVFAAGGTALPAVAGFAAQGCRQGVLLRWTPLADAPGEVLLQRTQMEDAPATAAPARGGATKAQKANTVLWLQADPGKGAAQGTIDASAVEGVPYRYVAVRRTLVPVGGRTLELRSAVSAPATVTWRDVYPPSVPEGLTALGFTAPPTQGQAEHYAVDLVWQPVLDERLAGYVVYREALNAAGQPAGAKERLTGAPVSVPGYHDGSAGAGLRYRYGVTAIDPKGNESAPATVEVGAAGR